MFYRNYRNGEETHVHNIGGANIYVSEDGNPFSIAAYFGNPNDLPNVFRIDQKDYLVYKRVSRKWYHFGFDIRCYVTEVGYVEDVENGEDIPIVKTEPLRKEGHTLWWINKTGKPELREG